MDHHRGTKDIHANYPNARRLVGEFPEKAVELIASTCEYYQIEASITHASLAKANMVSAGRNAYSALESPYARAPSSTSSQHSASATSPPTMKGSSYHSRPRGHTAALPPSPAPTSSSGKSIRPEYINVPISGGKECKLSMKRGLTEHSVIRHSIVENRLKDEVQIEEVPNGPLQMPYHAAPHGLLTSSWQAEVTWRRDNSHKTHQSIFYLVSEEIDCDILLGEADSGGEYNAGAYFDAMFGDGGEADSCHHTAMGAKFRGQHGTTVTGHPNMYSPGPQRPVPASFYPHSQVPPHAPEVPSYHLSSHRPGSNPSPVSVLHQRPNQGYPGLSDLNRHVGHQEPPIMSHLSSHGQPVPGNASPHSQVPEQGSISEELKVECTWDRTSCIVKLDLHAPAENFLATLEKRRKKILDRSNHTIRFTDSKGSECSFLLALEESDFTDDWQSALEWIRENKGAARLYAVVELEDG